MTSAGKGKLFLLLHAHLPFVRNPDYDHYLEENWFFEALSETYLPIITLLSRLAEKGFPGALNLSVSAPLLAMMQDELLLKRYSRHLDEQLHLSEKELARFAGDPAHYEIARFYHDRQMELIRVWNDVCVHDVLSQFRSLEKRGKLNILTCVGTHPFLPAYQGAPDVIRFQLALTVRAFEDAFHKRPEGLWLPECGYFEGLDKLLAEFGFKYFFLETHGVLLAKPTPRYGVFSPIRTPAGLYCMGREQTSSVEVWSRTHGYPGHPEYREFFRDIGKERDRGYLGEYFFAGDNPVDTGFKYYRITGGEDKALYRPWQALQLAREHARLFISNREATIASLTDGMENGFPSILCPYDAELFGHWWFEGPQFIESLFERAAISHVLEMDSLADIAKACADDEPHIPAFSSWGEGGFGSVWINGEVEWMYPMFYKMRATFHALPAPGSEIQNRLLAQMAREMALFQASDWAFMIHNHSAADFAKAQLGEHYNNFVKLASGYAQPDDATVQFLNKTEAKDNPFPWMDSSVYGALRS